MNKDIQTLIEREANTYAVSNIDNPKSLYSHLSKQTQDDVFDTVDSSFQAGASFALSLFKWRKVSEGDIPVNQPIILRLGDDYTLITISYKEIAEYANDKWKDGEWMPIPDND